MRRADSRDSVYSASSCVSGVGGWQIGDRARLGDRIGRIEFIGTTQFAPGEWIGLVLDGPHGKNDGSVNGVRYFTCDPNHGLFCKSGKLERIASIDSPSRFKSPTPGNSSIGGESSAYATECGYDIGERVLVAGGKLGTVRYLGTADFAQGLWAGVELDQPYGKNDGSVQGKRYFTCKAPYGIFVSASKVQRAPNQSTPVRNDMYHHNKASILRTSRAHGGSHESLSSIGRSSLASSRFGVLKRPGIRPNIVTGNAENNQMLLSLQEAVREKDSHLEKLLAERDSMKEEMAQLHKRIQQLEKSGSASESGSPAPVDSKQFEELKQKISKLSTENDELQKQLAEKQSAIENFSFQMDEVNIEKDVKIKELEEKLAALTTSSTNASREATAEVEARIRETTEKMQKQEAEFKLNLGKSAENVAQLENELAKLKEQYSVQLYELEETVQLKTYSADEAQAQLIKATQEIEGLKQQHATYEEAIKTKSSSSEEATLQLAQLKVEIEKMKQQHAALEEAIKQKDASVEELKTHLAKEKEEHEKMKEQVLYLEESVQVKTKVEHELSGELAKANEQIEGLKQQSAASGEELRAQLIKAKEELERAAAERKQESEALNQKLAASEEEKRTIQETFEQNKLQNSAQIEKMTSEGNDLKRDSETLNQKLAASEDERKRLQEAFEQLKLQNSAEVESLRNNIESLEQANTSSESQLTKANQELQAKNGQLTEEGNDLTQKLAESNEERKKIQEILEQMKLQNAADLEKLQKSEHELSAELTKARAEIEGLKQQHATFEEAIKAKSSSSEEAHLELAQLKAEIEKMRHDHASEVSTLQGSIGEEKRLTDQAKEEIQRLKQQSAASGEELMSQLTKAKEELERAAAERKQESEALNQKLAVSEGEKRTIQEALEQMKLQNSSLEDSLKMSGATSEQANTHLLELKAEIERITLESSHLRQESEALSQKLAVSEEERRTTQEALEQMKLQSSSEMESLQKKVVSLEQANASSESQLAKTDQELQAKIQQATEEGNSLNQKLVANDEEKRKLEGTVEQMKLQISSLEDSLKMSGATSEQANTHLLELKAEIERITLESSHLRQESEALNQKLAVSEEERRTTQEALEQMKLQNSSEVESLQKKVVSLEQANVSSESQLAKTNQELQAKIEQMVAIEADLRKKSELADQNLFTSEEERKKLLENLEQMKIQNSSEVESLQKKVVSLEQANASSESQLAKTNQELQAKVEQMIQEGNDLSLKLTASEEEKTHLQRTIEQMKLQSSSEMESLIQKMTTLEMSNASVDSQVSERNQELQAKVENVESESKELKQRLDLYMEIEEQTRRKNVHLSEKIGDLELQIDALTSQNKDEQTVALVQQIDFLNSIIASQQKKDEKRKAKIEELKSQIAEMQTNGGDSVVGRKSVAKLLEKKDKPPRTYCDICELFDQHETQDCPQQVLQAAEFAAHSHHHSPEKDGRKTKPPPREYCDNCEEFGHDTEKCPKKSKKKEYTF